MVRGDGGERVVNGFARRAGRFQRAICAACAIALAPTCAEAGAWTEPEGEGLMIATLWGWTGVGSPWGGNPAVNENRAELQLFGEYGLSDAWTVFGQMGIENYSLSQPETSRYAGLDYSDVGVRAKLWTSGQWVFSGEATFFMPGISPATGTVIAGISPAVKTE